ncbi:MAG: hypothetical protein JWQ11_4475 [Rhizobacter sp.]|nr:hypothetical protein [Rhizobacter sp.]
MIGNVGSSIAQGLLGMVSNVPVFGALFKPLTDALSSLFGGQQGGSNVQSAMDDYTNGTADADQLCNTVSNGLSGSAQSDNGGPVDQLKQFLAAQKQSGGQVDGDKLMTLLQSLQGGSSGSSNNATSLANAAGSQGISF